MKTFTQLILPLLIVVAGVGGFTFMSQYTRKAPEVKPRTVDGPTVPGAPTVTLTERDRTAVWDITDEDYSAEFEKGTKAHYDFWVANANSKPVEVRLQHQSCTCTEVQLGYLPAAEAAKWRRQTGQFAAVDFVSGVTGGPLLGGALALVGVAPITQWQTFPTNLRESLQVPAADPQAGPQLAVVRLKWDMKEAQPQRLTATINRRIDELVDEIRFEVPVRGVLPLMVSTANLLVGDLNYNEERRIGFYCWSCTRPSLEVRVEEVLRDPCIDVRPPRPLTTAELADLPEKLNAPGMRVKCGYYVEVVVYERRDGHQLDLGPLLRKLTLTSGADLEPLTVLLNGWVRTGALQVGESADRDRIDLGNFRSDRGTEKTVKITSTEPGLKLQLVSQSPDALKVALTELPPTSVRRQWNLTVEFEADKHSGLLPANSAVILQTTTGQPRKIRIPVVGNATR